MEHHEHIIGDPIEITEEDMGRTEMMEMGGEEDAYGSIMPITVASAPSAPNALEETAKQEVASIEQEETALLSPLEMQIAEEKLNNISNRDIARRLGVSDKVVRIVLSRRRVRAYVKDVFDSVTTADKEMRMQLMAAMIENKMEEEGINSKLDLAQLVQMLDTMGKTKEQADLGSQGNVMINILNNLKKDG
jgi:DNA-binding CsgD family transcriptional regulator